MSSERSEWRACGPDGWVAPVSNLISNSLVGYPNFVEIEMGLAREKCLRVPGTHIIAMGDNMVFLNLTAAQLDAMSQYGGEPWLHAV
jgi:hypothetical protein